MLSYLGTNILFGTSERERERVGTVIKVKNMYNKSIIEVAAKDLSTIDCTWETSNPSQAQSMKFIIIPPPHTPPKR